MGRPKKEKKIVQPRFRLEAEDVDFLDAEAARLGVTRDQLVHDAINVLRKKKAQKYKGYKWVVMSKPWTCFKCGRKYPPLTKAMYNLDGYGEAACPECVVKQEQTDEVAAKFYIAQLRLRKINKGLDKQAKERAEELLALKQEVDIYKLGLKHEQLEKEKEQLMKWNREFLQKHFGTDRDREAIEKLEQKLKEIEELQREIREKIRKLLLLPLKKRKKEKTYA